MNIYNTTTQEKNENQINDDQLIQNLDPGLYKVEKDYDNGEKEEIIIQKTNND